MHTPIRTLALSASLALAACHSEPTFERSNAASSGEVSDIANGTGINDGRQDQPVPTDPDTAGQSMRAASTRGPQ